jgi:hypothetical protein
MIRSSLLAAVAATAAVLVPATAVAAATVERECGAMKFGTKVDSFQAQQIHTGNITCARARRLIAAEFYDGRGDRTIGCPGGWRCESVGNGGKDVWRRGAARISFFEVF